MKVFISSVVSGFGAERDAAFEAASTLGLEVRRCEDFAASEESAQQVCLQGVRWADCVVLVLGERYGTVQPSGLSATHEEYREARERGTALAFVESGISPESRQAAFIAEVREWQAGLLTQNFTTPENLKGKTIKALHDFVIRQTQGRPDAAELRAEALGMMPRGSLGYRPMTHVAVAVFPKAVLLSPRQLQSDGLQSSIRQTALVGPHAILDPEVGSTFQISSEQVCLKQPSGPQVKIDQSGLLLLSADVSHRMKMPGALTVIVQEELTEILARTYRLASVLLDLVDERRSVTHVLPVTRLDHGHAPIRTLQEHSASPSSMTIPMAPERLTVEWPPGPLARAALAREADSLAADVVAELKTKMGG
ncbi:DUF4062 domain-containing protein [Candidatus Cryosericum septentrionale]|jgi:hypothetical protein|uniref:DUF4062 domain-containing protein n=1 Tax=Candidatus Cryosericum septentrionale TaxID=2290913 RepID=A0A398DWX7_9BACT|nr:DUF4062 domain-containing protein [Candidatus Cryosericum septentrionale]RIE15824.1 DUF4062 domain-containing protein [Candidatus Cryosericum septentrionale]